MTDSRDLLIEIGTEELPPKALRKLSEAFQQGILDGLQKAELAYMDCRLFATPRRIALVISLLAGKQADKTIQRRGPALTAAFGDDGVPTRAAEGFARSCGVSVDDLETLKTDEGAWLSYELQETGKPTQELLGDIIGQSLDELPIPKRMRWGDRHDQFVRPVHWVIVLFDDEVVPTTILGINSGQQTRGHRFHAPDWLTVGHPSGYEMLLESDGHVIADFDRRREAIRAQIDNIARDHNGRAIIDEDLLDEVTAMVEWPQAVLGNFDARFLEVPAEALISSMKSHQKYFHMLDDKQQLMPHFITISNIESRDISRVRAGNERVIRPRLSDAEFFWQQDRKQPLHHHLQSLAGVIFQKQLGSLHDKAERVSKLATCIAEQTGHDKLNAERAGLLCKCDLMSNMVGEFPDLQGIMGRYYAQHDKEPADVAQAIEEHYLPRFAGDVLPASGTGLCVAIADKLDTLTGIFGIGQPPTGEKDPFALRRAALGVLRMLVEKQLAINLPSLIRQSFDLFQGKSLDSSTPAAVYDFVLGRMDVYFANKGFTQDEIAAVISLRPESFADLEKRLEAIATFRKLPAAESLAAANKRIGNILKKAIDVTLGNVDTAKLTDPEEKALHASVVAMQQKVQPLLQNTQYTEALTQLADLKDPIDTFFDHVMVMTDDVSLRDNRLCLLNDVHRLFMQIADLSKLQH